MNDKKLFCVNFWAGVIGTTLEFYDTAVFSLLAPFLAPLFFPSFDPITAMILTYGALSIGSFGKPLGSLFFGYFGDRFGRLRAMSNCMIGLAIVTGLAGCLPTYQQAGYLAPLLMTFARFFQNFFIGGETAGGAVFILEHTKESKHSLISSLYGCSMIAGIVLASGLITLISWSGNMATLWRVPFLFGFFTAVAGIFLRRNAQESPQFVAKKTPELSIFKSLNRYKIPFLGIMGVSGFSSCNYILAFILPNGFLPKVSSITSTEIMAINTFLLLIDMALLPLFGWLSDWLSPRRSMLIAAAASSALAFPLYSFFDGANWMQIVFVRTMLVALGVWFSAPLHAWIQTLVPLQSRYLVLSLGYALGSQLIGGPAASLSLWLYRETGWVGAPGLYWTAAASFAALCISLQPKKNEKELQAPSQLQTA